MQNRTCRGVKEQWGTESSQCFFLKKKEPFCSDLNRHSTELDRGSVLCITPWFIYT